MPRVLNKRADHIPDDAIYVGRPSRWGNPYVMKKDGDRDEVIARYEKYLEEHSLLIEAARRELRGRDLVCWCAPSGGVTADDPLICHGQILLKVANDG